MFLQLLRGYRTPITTSRNVGRGVVTLMPYLAHVECRVCCLLFRRRSVSSPSRVTRRNGCWPTEGTAGAGRPLGGGEGRGGSLANLTAHTPRRRRSVTVVHVPSSGEKDDDNLGTGGYPTKGSQTSKLD